ncbi:MAG: hypothetical protein M3Y72_17815 [Acidobacteriota bacterium]|nr:hypothetical protein [Acidobacteriota bacterium]
MLSSIALFAAADKSFQPGPPTEYAHQQSENVTVGAKPYDNEDLVNDAFGKKIDFPKYGVLPVLVVIQNKREKALDLRDLEVSLVATDGRHAKAVAPEDLPFLATAGKHPSQTGVRVPVPLPKKKNPLNASEITLRAFAAKMLAPGDSASGFLYFEAHPESGDKLYLNGMRDARSGQELLYFEFPLDKSASSQ